MKLCQSSLKEPNENRQCILRSDEPKINESGSNEVQNVWHRWAWDHHCSKTWERVSAGMSAKNNNTHSRGTWTVFCYSKRDNWVCSFQVTHANSVYACVSVCMGISLNKLFRLLLMKLQADPLTFWRMTAATPQPHLMLCLGFSLNRSTAWVTPELWTEPGSTFKTSIISNLNVLQWVRCTSDRMLFDLPSFHSL